MRTVYRYPLQLTESQTITGPGLGRVVAVDNRRGEIESWAEVDLNSNKPYRTVRIVIVGTGNAHLDKLKGDYYVGHLLDGPFVWHIYASEPEET